MKEREFIRILEALGFARTGNSRSFKKDDVNVTCLGNCAVVNGPDSRWHLNDDILAILDPERKFSDPRQEALQRLATEWETEAKKLRDDIPKTTNSYLYHKMMTAITVKESCAAELRKVLAL